MTAAHIRNAFLAAVCAISCKQQPAKPVKSETPLVKEVTASSKGFAPQDIQVAPGQQLVLRFTRTEEQTCADAVDVQGDPVRHMLPVGKPIDVKVTAPPSGQITFACPMNMFQGAVRVVQ
jgi:plastocyanin domain-containing protein